MLDGTGYLVPAETSNKILERVWTTLDKAIEYSTEHSKSIDVSASLFDFFTSEANKLALAGEIGEYERGLFLGMAEMWGAYVGDRVEKQSLKFFFLEDCIDGGENSPVFISMF